MASPWLMKEVRIKKTGVTGRLVAIYKTQKGITLLVKSAAVDHNISGLPEDFKIEDYLELSIRKDQR